MRHPLRALVLVGLLLAWALPAQATFLKNTVTNAANLTDGQLLVGDLGAHGVKTFAACTDGLIITWSGGAIVCGSVSAANPALSNLASVAINLSLIPGAAGTLDLGSATLPWEFLFVSGTSGTPGTNNFKITGASTSGTRVITLPDATTTLPSISGTPTTNNCVKWGSATQLADAGSTCGGGGASALSAITAAAGANTIASGDNAQVWDWTLTTAAKSAFKFNETAAATNGAGSQFLVDIGTLATSTAAPLIVRALGTEVFRVPAAGAQIQAANGTVSVPMYSFAGATSTGMYQVNNILLFTANGTNVLQLASNGALFIAGSNSALSITDTAFGTGGLWFGSNLVGTKGHQIASMATAPAITSGCGTGSPSIVGNDNVFLVTLGTTPGTCLITFNVAFATNAPVCMAIKQGTTTIVADTEATTTVSLAATGLTGVIEVLCKGWL